MPTYTPRQAHLCSPRYVAAQAQCVYYGIVSRLPMVASVPPVPLLPRPRAVLTVCSSPYRRVTLTDYRGTVLLDSYVRPT